MGDASRRGKAADVFAGTSEDRIEVLAREVRSESPSLQLIRNMLRYKIPIEAVSSDGQTIFEIALQRGNADVIRLLCEASEGVDNIIRALFRYLPREKQVLKCLPICMATLAPTAAHIIDPAVLYKALSTFPEGDRLVNKLLDYGVPAGTRVEWRLCREWVYESVTPLLWALFQKKRVSNSTLLALIARGEQGKPFLVLSRHFQH